MALSQAKKTRIMEVSLAVHFKYSKNIIVPNVFWGVGLRYEADMVVLRPSGYAIEIEIKASAADILADTKKRYNHDGVAYWGGQRVQVFKELWFALPIELAENPNIPGRAGVIGITFSKSGDAGYVQTIRKPQTNSEAIRWTDDMKANLMRLGLLRVWGLKRKEIRRAP